MRRIFEIKDLVNIEEKAKTLDWGGDDGLGNMWDLYFKNPTFDKLDTVCHALGVAVDWCRFEKLSTTMINFQETTTTQAWALPSKKGITTKMKQ
jgi:hypothetical protein